MTKTLKLLSSSSKIKQAIKYPFHQWPLYKDAQLDIKLHSSSKTKNVSASQKSKATNNVGNQNKLIIII